jgi:hypothetical protein
VTSTELHELHLALAKEERHFAFEGERWPSQTRNALRIAEQARKATKFRFPVVLAALSARSLAAIFRLTPSAARTRHSARKPR